MEAVSLSAIIWQLILVMLLVLLNGFFVAAEFAVVKIRETQLIPDINKGNRRARVARGIVKNLDAALSAAQLGITLASLGLGWVGEPVFAALLHPVVEALQIQSQEARHSLSFFVGFSVITFLHITVGELAPKSMAIRFPLSTTLWVAYPMRWFYLVSYPFIYVLNNASLWMLRQIGIQPVNESELTHTRDELRVLIAQSHQHTPGTAIGKDIVLNALELSQRIVRHVMQSRQEMSVLDTEASIAECLDVAEKTRFSRFPLCQDGNLDKTLGVVHFKDMFAMRLRAKRGADLQNVARKLIYVPETARLETLLQHFLDRRLHFAIVVDEFGGTAGMVTLENILEELVGQIQDEFDQEIPMLVPRGESAWDVQGAMPLHELEELVEQPLQEEGLTTTSGWITHRLEGFPKPGDTLVVGNFQLRVEEVDERRVGRVSVMRIDKQSEQAKEKEQAQGRERGKERENE